MFSSLKPKIFQLVLMYNPGPPSTSHLLPFGPPLSSYMLCMSVFQFHFWPPSLTIPFTFSLCFLFSIWIISTMCIYYSLHKYLLKYAMNQILSLFCMLWNMPMNRTIAIPGQEREKTRNGMR